MSTVISNDKHYKGLASKIRRILGTTTLYKPSEMPQSIRNMQSIIDECATITNGVIYSGDASKIVGTKMYPGAFDHYNIRTFQVPENITELPDYAFCQSEIKNIILHDNITSIGKMCFYCCYDLTSINFPASLTTIGDSAFQGSKLAGEVVLPTSLTYLGSYQFAVTNISLIDIPSGISTIKSSTFRSCRSLKSLILRRTSSVCTCSDTLVLYDTPIKDGTGYIYVPSALVDSYKAATNWSTYANQFRALEDYTVDGTVTGEFDYSKI